MSDEPKAEPAEPGKKRPSLAERMKALADKAAATAASGTTKPPASGAAARPPASGESAPAARPAPPPRPPASDQETPATPAAARPQTPQERAGERFARVGITSKTPPEPPPSAPAPPPAAPASGTALATDRIAMRLRGEVPRGTAATSVAAPPPPAAPPAPEADAKPRTKSPYVVDSIFEKLPENFQEIILDAANPNKAQSVMAWLRTIKGPDYEAQRELLRGFIENMEAVLRRRFLPDDIEKYVFRDPPRFPGGNGDFSLRWGDGEIKVLATCWDFFFLARTRRPLDRDRIADIQRRFSECFRFELANTPICPMKVLTPVQFDPSDEAAYLEASLEIGGWCDMKFESAAAFTDGRLFVVTLGPRVIRGKDLPPGKAKTPREFVELLKKMRRR